MTAVATQTRPVTKVVYTGHKPPAEQIAGQRRSSTGMTFGANAHRLPPGWPGGNVVPRAVPKREVAEPVTGLFLRGSDQNTDAQALLTLFQQLADRGEELPRCTEIGAMLVGADRPKLGSTVYNRLRAMVSAQQIAWCYGSVKPYRGEMVIRVIATGRELRTHGAPASWKVPV